MSCFQVSWNRQTQSQTATLLRLVPWVQPLLLQEPLLEQEESGQNRPLKKAVDVGYHTCALLIHRANHRFGNVGMGGFVAIGGADVRRDHNYFCT